MWKETYVQPLYVHVCCIQKTPKISKKSFDLFREGPGKKDIFPKLWLHGGGYLIGKAHLPSTQPKRPDSAAFRGCRWWLLRTRRGAPCGIHPMSPPLSDHHVHGLYQSRSLDVAGIVNFTVDHIFGRKMMGIWWQRSCEVGQRHPTIVEMSGNLFSGPAKTKTWYRQYTDTIKVRNKKTRKRVRLYIYIWIMLLRQTIKNNKPITHFCKISVGWLIAHYWCVVWTQGKYQSLVFFHPRKHQPVVIVWELPKPQMFFSPLFGWFIAISPHSTV